MTNGLCVARQSPAPASNRAIELTARERGFRTTPAFVALDCKLVMTFAVKAPKMQRWLVAC